MNSNANIQWTTLSTSPNRPKLVSAVILWLGFFAGLLPIGAALFVYFGPVRDMGLISGQGLATSITLGLAVLGSAIAAWFGHGWARYALIALCVVHYGLLAYNNYHLATSGIVPDAKLTMVWGRMVRSLITMTIVVLYLLLSRNVRDFFANSRRET